MKKYESKYELSKMGKFFYNLTMNWAHFLMHHKGLYYVLSCTWGIIMTLISFLALIGFSVCGMPLHKYYWVSYYQFGKYWGGMETGLIFFRDTTSVDSLNQHEFGHTFQNTLFGPFAIFISFLPSAFRYWWRRIKYNITKKPNPRPYNAVWFEASASDAGKMVVEYLESIKKN